MDSFSVEASGANDPPPRLSNSVVYTVSKTVRLQYQVKKVCVNFNFQGAAKSTPLDSRVAKG